MKFSCCGNLLLVFYLILDHCVPCPSTQAKTDDEFKDILRYVGNNGVDPDDCCPSPSNTLDPGEFPVCIYSKHCSNLKVVIFG